jgi:hypothetical protein
MPMGNSLEPAQEDSAQRRVSTHDSARQHRALKPSRHLSLFETNRSALIARAIVNQSNVGPQGGSALRGDWPARRSGARPGGSRVDPDESWADRGF